MGTVSKISFVSKVWNATDIASKCIIHPNQEEFPNPFPDSVRFAAPSVPEMIAEHSKVFGPIATQTWTVISLLLPGREYWVSTGGLFDHFCQIVRFLLLPYVLL